MICTKIAIIVENMCGPDTKKLSELSAIFIKLPTAIKYDFYEKYLHPDLLFNSDINGILQK
jgi:hypothetical protein